MAPVPRFRRRVCVGVHENDDCLSKIGTVASEEVQEGVGEGLVPATVGHVTSGHFGTAQLQQELPVRNGFQNPDIDFFVARSQKVC